jgi:F0F1-type ATP synthase membrane subunit c/vacuolar-type H+-ATPase subunit K
MTGVPRVALVAVRLPAAVIVTLAALVPAFVLGLICSAALPAESGDALTAADVGAALWATVLWTALWTSLGVGIGSLFNSTGAGIAVTLAISIVGTPALGALQLLWEPLAVIPLGNALTVLSGYDGGYGGVWAAVLVALLWILVPIGAAATRMRRAEL